MYHDWRSIYMKRFAMFLEFCLTEVCYGVNCVPSETYVELLTTVPRSVTLFVNRVIADVIS